MYQDLIIMFGIIFFIYKLITHKGELSLARIIYTFSLVLGLGIFFLRNLISVNVNIRMYNFDDVQCTVIPSVAYGFVTGMNLQLC